MHTFILRIYICGIQLQEQRYHISGIAVPVYWNSGAILAGIFNWSENSIRPVTVGRKNWLFSSSVDGAEASMNIYTIIEMAKLHGLNRQKYLEYILEHRPSAEMTDEELSLLAPWNKDVQETCGKCDH